MCDVDKAISRCPFLHNLSQAQGKAYASSVAINPLLPAPSARRPILEELHDFSNTFKLFHGPGGVVPLSGGPRLSEASAAPLPSAPPPCLHLQQTLQAQQQPRLVQQQLLHADTALAAPPKGPPIRSPFGGAPLATISLGMGMPDFGDLFRKLQRQHGPSNNRKPPGQGGVRKPHANGNGPKPRTDIGKPQGASSSSTVQPPSSNSGSVAPSTGGSSLSANGGGQCPLRKILGPSLSGLIFNSAGNLQCPPAIIHARAALAATAPVRQLRPQALPVKLIAVGAVAAMANVPCGMWREHTKKFSWQWFLAVHASIPFIAMLRKAVIMPKLAIICTIAAAIAGQAIGARLERERMLEEAAAAAATTPAPAPAVAAEVLSRPLVRGRARRSGGKAMVASTGLAAHAGSSLSSPAGPSSSSCSRDELTWLDMNSADWRLEQPLQTSFKQLLSLPSPVAVR